MMAFPVRALSRPSALSGESNGRLSASILTSTPGRAGGLDVLLVGVASRAWRALEAAAADAGHVLKLSGGGCGYRSFVIQERIFRERYTTTYLPNRPYKTWNGQRWYQKAGTAVAAVPGTSNHGWGLAVDIGEERDSDLAAEPLDSATLGWLLANEERFGFSHELQSEPWHLRYFPGDHIPQAVLDFERQTPPPEEDDMPPPKIIKGDASTEWWITDGIVKRHITSAEHAQQLAYLGYATLQADNKPFTVPQGMVDGIPTLGGGPGASAEQVADVFARRLAG